MFFDQSEPSDHPARLWVRLPNWLGDVVMAIPLIRALQSSRPDLEITLLGQSHFLPLLEKIATDTQRIALPRKGGLGYFGECIAFRKHAPDVHVLFTNSTRGDLEARLIGAPHRFGIERPGKRRPLLTDTWSMPADLDEATIHQTWLWERFLQHFGLDQDLDLSPSLAFPGKPTPGRIGLICATENAPEKRWPVERWRELIDRLPDQEFHLFGTARDIEITTTVAEGFPSDRVINRAGRTGLVEFAEELAQCEALIGNDTGGMHLANLLGVPLVGVFGPTNPIRTGPIFDAPAIVIQPEKCPGTGGADIDEISDSQVVEALNEFPQ